MDGFWEKDPSHNCCQRFWLSFKRWWFLYGTTTIFIVLYLIINAGLFMESSYFSRYTYYRWRRDDKGPYLLFGQGVLFARGAAAALKLNCAVILIPVLRNFLAWLRGTWFNNVLPIDHAIWFHQFVGWLIAFFSAMHTIAHFFNYKTLWYADPGEINQALGTDFTESPNPYASAFLTLAGITGHVMIVCMVLMYTSAIPSIRRPFFEVFWYTHHLFVVFYGCLLVHGLQGRLEEATFWMWFVGPGTAYVIERTIRIIRGSKPVLLVKAVQHPSRVIELQLRKDDFHFKPGQYLFLNMPYLSSQEWHPFTISSSPHEECITLHIRIVGDWTGKLYRELNPEKKETGVLAERIMTARNGKPIFKIDGPFGAASEDIFDYQYVMLIAAGIGVTPFASVLKTIRDQLNLRPGELPLKKVYFFWIARDKACFEWFADLLSELESNNVNEFLDINIYFTGAIKDPEQIKGIMLQPDDQPDAITGLQARTHFARPRWDHIFPQIRDRHPGQTIGCFFCGPPLLSRTLYKCCAKYTEKRRGGTRFRYKKENF